MRIQTDSLKYAKMLINQGFSPKHAEGLLFMFSKMEIRNLYSIDEVDTMLSETVKKVFDEQDKKLAEQRREFDERMKLMHEQRLEDRNGLIASRREDRSELIASRRWMIGTVITVGLSLAAYLSALFHFNH